MMIPKYKVGDILIFRPFTQRGDLNDKQKRIINNPMKIVGIINVQGTNRLLYKMWLYRNNSYLHIVVGAVDKYFKKSRRIAFNFGKYGKGDR